MVMVLTGGPAARKPAKIIKRFCCWRKALTGQPTSEREARDSLQFSSVLVAVCTGLILISIPALIAKINSLEVQLAELATQQKNMVTLLADYKALREDHESLKNELIILRERYERK